MNNSCGICAKHFVEADIETITINSWKKAESENEPVELKSLSEAICNYQYFFPTSQRNCQTNHQNVTILDVFKKSAAHALEYDAEKNPEFVGTSKFMKFISNIWKTMSVTTPKKGISGCQMQITYK